MSISQLGIANRKSSIIALILTFCIIAISPLPAAEAPIKKPSVLIIYGSGSNGQFGDYNYYTQLNQRGFQIDYHFLDEQPYREMNWDLIKQYNCLVIVGPPGVEGGLCSWGRPPYHKEMQALLDAFLTDGGGVFWMLPPLGPGHGLFREMYLKTWGAEIPYEQIQDPATQKTHPRNQCSFIYADQVAASPVSEGVKGAWFPVTISDYMEMYGSPLLVSKDWIEVLRGSKTSFTADPSLRYKLDPEGERAYKMRSHSPDMKIPPTLFAIREAGNGRMALTDLNNVFTFFGGTSWIHDGVVLDKGMAGKPSDFGKLFENTLRWLSEPSLKNGKLGGYVQDSAKLLHPHFRKSPESYFSAFDSYQNPTAPGNVYRGLIGARTTYSSGKGSVSEYAAAATEAGLDFVIFLDELGMLTEEKYRQLEEDCRKSSTDKLLLLPGFTFKNNIKNNMFAFGRDIVWPSKAASQWVGKDRDELKQAYFDDKGQLAIATFDVWGWPETFPLKPVGQRFRNLGYYNFDEPTACPVRDLKWFGILGVMTYVNGKLVEDLTPDYLNYAVDGNPPLACAVDLVQSPQELKQAVKAQHYLTQVAASTLKNVPAAMQYGMQYGRANVYPSSGPQIKSWAGTFRIFSYAGEPFVPGRYRIRPLCWVTSDVGIKEIVIYCDRKPFRRFLLNGAKEFKQTFEWAYDRQRTLTMEVTDVEGRRALSAGYEFWAESNYLSWCGDRQNGELCHGPVWSFVHPFETGRGGGLAAGSGFSVGPTWDGGPPAQPSMSFNLLPSFTELAEGQRPMEGDEWPTCIDDSVRNVAARGDHNYAPGAVGNCYSTYGPIYPSEYMSYTMRRTQYIPKPVGPLLDLHAMWVERSGGALDLFEGTMTFRKDTPAQELNILLMKTVNFPKGGGNIPIFGVCENQDSLPRCGSMESYGTGGRFTLAPGGFTATLPSGEGVASAVFNLGDAPINTLLLNSWWYFRLPVQGRSFKKGETISWRYLVMQDALKQADHSISRVERLRQYYGLDGKHDSGIQVKRGKLLSHFGLVDLAPENGIVEFEVPAPDFALQLPLGLRFIGFNPNWTVGQYQISGYTTGFYTKGNNVYRNLATDDRDMVYLAVYPDNIPVSHSVVGHPVQCDNPKLIIEVTQLNDKPVQWHVAVNNPTDTPISATLRKTMNIPGFDFTDTKVEVPPGGYKVVFSQLPPPLPPPPPSRPPSIRARPDFLSLVPHEGGGNAVRLSMTSVDKVVSWQAGAFVNLKKKLKSEDGKPYRVFVRFDARHIAGSSSLSVRRPWGGSTAVNFSLSKDWKSYSGTFEGDPDFTSEDLVFSMTVDSYAGNGTCEIDNVVVQRIDKDGNPIGENLVANGSFEQNLENWSGRAQDAQKP